jgi:glycosyltransferase involved in cell wall biosynthesis
MEALRVVRSGPFGTIGRAGLDAVRALVLEADLVHIHGVWEPSVLQVARLARAARRPYLVSPRGMLDDYSLSVHPFRKRAHLLLAGRRLIHRAAAVHCTASGEADQIGRRFPRVRLRTIPNVIQIEALLALPRRESDHPTILHLGRLHPKKGIELLIDAVAGDRRLHAVELRIAGSGAPAYERSLRRRAACLGDRCRFVGHVDAADRGRLLSEAWLMASPTSQENFGNALFESLAAGVPLVTSAGLDADDELRASGGAVLTDRSAHAVAAAVLGLLGAADRRRAMGASARAWVRTHLGVDVLGAAYEALYRDLARGGAR